MNDAGAILSRRFHLVVIMAVFFACVLPGGSRAEQDSASSKTIVMLGDSITAMGDWSALFPGEDIRNFGIHGDGTGGMLRRIESVTDLHPAKIFILMGTNDLGRTVPIPDLIDDYRDTLEAIHKKSPASEVYIQSLLPRRRLEAEIIDANEQLKMLADVSGYKYLDLYSVFLDHGGHTNTNLYNKDGLHLAPGGYQLWKKVIADCITGEC